MKIQLSYTIRHASMVLTLCDGLRRVSGSRKEPVVSKKNLTLPYRDVILIII